MKKVGEGLPGVIARMGGDSQTARVTLRINQVQARYRHVIESVYPPQTAQLHLAHTNTVIIRKVKDVSTLIVYVDDSLFAAELNAQRELIKLFLLEQFGEEIEDFKIQISRWKRYRERHPYLEESENDPKESTSIPLDDSEKSYVSRTVSKIANEKVRKSLEKAMTADLEWKKGEKVELERKKTK